MGILPNVECDAVECLRYCKIILMIEKEYQWRYLIDRPIQEWSVATLITFQRDFDHSLLKAKAIKETERHQVAALRLVESMQRPTIATINPAAHSVWTIQTFDCKISSDKQKQNRCSKAATTFMATTTSSAYKLAYTGKWKEGYIRTTHQSSQLGMMVPPPSLVVLESRQPAVKAIRQLAPTAFRF